MSDLAGIRVLLIEDEPIVAVLAEDMLDVIGCIVAATVATVSAALAAVASLSFDMAMVDINLDGEDGLAVADALRARGIPYLITTGYDAHGAAPGHSPASILTKPYALIDLEAAIRRCVAGRD
jgi:CheY-like chemotaxis protein